MNVVTIVALIALAGACWADGDDQQNWIRKTVRVLRTDDLLRDPQLALVSAGKVGKLKYQIQGNSGLIRFSNAGWVFIVSHSSHAEEFDPTDKVGDISIAIDNEGNLYKNAAHVCGGITVQSDSPFGLSTIRDFLDAGIKIGTNVIPWSPIETEND